MPHSTSSSPNLARVAADGGFDGERVLQQAFAFRVLVQQSPGVFAAERRNHVVSLLPVNVLRGVQAVAARAIAFVDDADRRLGDGVAHEVRAGGPHRFLGVRRAARARRRWAGRGTRRARSET